MSQWAGCPAASGRVWCIATADAPARRPAAAGRADERSRHPDARGAGRESCWSFPGALVLVTHDRYMLDRVSTSVLGLDGEGAGACLPTTGNGSRRGRSARAVRNRTRRNDDSAAPAIVTPKKKLSYLEAREYDGIEARIHAAEAALAGAQAQMQDPAVTSDAERLQEAYARMQRAQSEMDALYERWAELESKLA